jgi:hypothetical protein
VAEIEGKDYTSKDKLSDAFKALLADTSKEEEEEVSEHILHLPPVLRLLLFLYSLTAGPIPNPTFGFRQACFSGPSLDPLYARARCI